MEIDVSEQTLLYVTSNYKLSCDAILRLLSFNPEIPGHLATFTVLFDR